MLIELIDRAKWKVGSQKELAKKLGIAPNRLSEIKHGTREPAPALILQLADIAGLNPAETLFQVMEKLDAEHAELWRIWRPYGDSNPGYRRERAMS